LSTRQFRTKRESFAATLRGAGRSSAGKAAKTTEIHDGRSGKSGKGIELGPVCAKIEDLRQGALY